MRLPATLFAALFLSSLACLALFDTRPAGAEEARELVVKRVKEAPPLKAELGDLFKDARALEIEVHGGRQKGAKVELRALSDGKNLYVLARWADPTKSAAKKAWEFKDGKWGTQKGDEDRIALAFGVKSDAFAAKGCAGACHGEAEKSMKCAEANGVVDLWHWKAARGGQNGFCDDQVINSEKRGDDKGKGAYKANVNAKDTKIPGWRWADKADRNGAFDETSVVEIDGNYKPSDGEVLPSIVIRRPDGSRGDVSAWSSYADGRWTVLLVRAIKTGNADDFEAAGRVPFSVALFDDTGSSDGSEHAKSDLCWLVAE